MLRKLSFQTRSTRRPEPGPDGRHSSFTSVSEDSENLGEFRANYLGSVSVDQPKGDETISSAAFRVKQTNREIVKVSLDVSNSQIKVTDRNTGDVLQNSPIGNVTYCGVDPADKKQFIYVAKSTKGSLLYGHVFQVKEKAAEIARAIHQAFASSGQDASTIVSSASGSNSESTVASPVPPPRHASTGSALSAQAPEAPARHSSVTSNLSVRVPESSRVSLGSSPVHLAPPPVATLAPAPSVSSVSSSSSVPGAPDSPLSEINIATYDAMYMGSVMVTEPKGMDVIVRAVEENREMFRMIQNARKKSAKKAMVDGEPVTLVVHPEGLRTVEPGSGEQKFFHFIKNITFSVALQDTFAYIFRDDRVQRIDCVIFNAAPGVANSICVSMQEVQRRAEAEQQRIQNPFAVTDQRREAVRGELFARQIHRADLAAVRAIGAGQFGEVYLARQALKLPSGPMQLERAVKLLRNAATPNDKTNFLREAEVMLGLQHTNLVQLVGVAVQQRPWLMVVEYMRYGDLRTVLKTMAEKRIKLHPLEQISWCMQIGAGMRFVASKKLVHMDLAARNCLLGTENLVKISDFGLTQKMETGKDHLVLRETLRLPIKWLALECVADKIFSEASDVWAFGVTAWEVFSYGAMPFGSVRTPDVPALVRDGLRLQQPEACSAGLYGIMTACWNTTRTARPNFERLVIQLADQLSQHGSAPHRDVGAVVFAEKGATLQRGATLAFEPATLVVQGETGGRVRVNSVSRSNPLFEASQTDPDTACPHCGVSLGGMDQLGLTLHASACKKTVDSVQTTSLNDMALLQSAITLADDDSNDETSTDMRPAQPAYINTVSRSSSQPSPSQRTPEPSYINAPQAQALRATPTGQSAAPALSARAPSPGPPIARQPSARTPSPGPIARTPAPTSAAGPQLARSPSVNTPVSTPRAAAPAPAATGPSPMTPVAAATAPAPSAIRPTPTPAPAPAPAPSPAPTAGAPKPAPAPSSSSSTSSAAAAAKESAELAAAKAQAEKLKLSAKAEAALRVHATGDIFSEGKVKHSKIFEALNPQRLAFQTARDRADREDVEVLGVVGIRSYAEASLALAPEMEELEGFGGDAEGGDEGDGEPEEEEAFDPHNLPDFGDFTGEMLQRRAERAAAEQQRRERMQKEAAARRAKEQADMERELETIRAREVLENKKKRVDDSFVVAAQKRLESELSFGSFVFQ